MKKILSIILTLVLIAALPLAGAMAADKETRPQVGTVSGTVTDIYDFYDTDGKVLEGRKYVQITDRDGGLHIFVVDDGTYFITGKGLEEVKTGDRFTGYYDATLPMIMIYPPQHHAIAVAVNPPADDYIIKVDRFDTNLVSSDNQLKLNLSGTTKITTRHGDAYTGELSGLTLAVIYHASTKSIPAQTTPSEIIVLEGYLKSEGDMYVVGIKLDTRDFYILYKGGDRIVMVPFRAVAETIGYAVTCEGDTVFIGPYATFQFAKDGYVYARLAPVMLGVAPHMVNNTTYVPLSYFKQVLGCNNAYYFEGQIVIDNNEAMN